LDEVSLEIFFTCNLAETIGLTGPDPDYFVGELLIADEFTLIVATRLSASFEIGLILVDADDTLRTLPPVAFS
jgi:hypothetical protein